MGRATGSARVLIVDDNVDAAIMLREVLEARGWCVEIAHSPQDALVLAAAFVPEVALLDIGLPEMDGYELARRIRSTGLVCRFVALTGYGSDAERVRSRDAGFSEHLTKPASITAILSAITSDG